MIKYIKIGFRSNTPKTTYICWRQVTVNSVSGSQQKGFLQVCLGSKLKLILFEFPKNTPEAFYDDKSVGNEFNLG